MRLGGGGVLLPPPTCPLTLSAGDVTVREPGERTWLRRLGCSLLAAALIALAATAQAAVGLTEIPGKEGEGTVTVYYPSSSDAQTVKRGPFSFQLAQDGAPRRGNGRLIMISHGSGGSPWVHANLARALVEVGFIVAMPAHRGDNYQDSSTPGPESWRRRPVEISHAIDVVGQDPRFRPLLALDKVGMYGMSAGGHTALSLAGGRWSPASFRQYCESHIGEDFQSCVGLITRLRGNILDARSKPWRSG
jgi:predicted dienelactone hydrolase